MLAAGKRCGLLCWRVSDEEIKYSGTPAPAFLHPQRGDHDRLLRPHLHDDRLGQVQTTPRPARGYLIHPGAQCYKTFCPQFTNLNFRTKLERL
jgi:hypothetical protein